MISELFNGVIIHTGQVPPEITLSNDSASGIPRGNEALESTDSPIDAVLSSGEGDRSTLAGRRYINE